MIVLTPIVEPWTKLEHCAGSRPALAIASLSPLRTPSAGAAGVDGVLCAGDAAVRVDDRDVGERAADVDANLEGCCSCHA
jgi:hypothetical protein